MTYSAIYDLYVDYVKSNYKNAVVAFDGYEGGPSTKDAAHLFKKNKTLYSDSSQLHRRHDPNFEKGFFSKK